MTRGQTIMSPTQVLLFAGLVTVAIGMDNMKKTHSNLARNAVGERSLGNELFRRRRKMALLCRRPNIFGLELPSSPSSPAPKISKKKVGKLLDRIDPKRLEAARSAAEKGDRREETPVHKTNELSNPKDEFSEEHGIVPVVEEHNNMPSPTADMEEHNMEEHNCEAHDIIIPSPTADTAPVNSEIQRLDLEQGPTRSRTFSTVRLITELLPPVETVQEEVSTRQRLMQSICEMPGKCDSLLEFYYNKMQPMMNTVTDLVDRLRTEWPYTIYYGGMVCPELMQKNVAFFEMYHGQTFRNIYQEIKDNSRLPADMFSNNPTLESLGLAEVQHYSYGLCIKQLEDKLKQLKADFCHKYVAARGMWELFSYEVPPVLTKKYELWRQ